MTSNSKAARKLGVRHVVAGAVLIASFALDGPAREARGLIVKAFPRWLLRSLSHGGDLLNLAAVVATLLAIGLIARRAGLGRAAVVLASALTGTAFVVLSLKWLASRGSDGVFYGFGRGEEGIMFPSGHTAMAFAACAVIGAVWRKARWPARVIAAGVAVSRATLIHFLSDVVAGAVIGMLVGQFVTGWAARAGFLDLDSDSRAARSPDL
jgi:membrane-associated phospholipid phosphatase